jgi:hypothetical protein
MEDLKSSWLRTTELVLTVWLLTMEKRFAFNYKRFAKPTLVHQVFPALQNTSLQSLDKVHYCI